MFSLTHFPELRMFVLAFLKCLFSSNQQIKGIKPTTAQIYKLHSYKKEVKISNPTCSDNSDILNFLHFIYFANVTFFLSLI